MDEVPDGAFSKLASFLEDGSVCVFWRADVLFQVVMEFDVADRRHVFGLREARVGAVGAAVVDFAGPAVSELRHGGLGGGAKWLGLSLVLEFVWSWVVRGWREVVSSETGVKWEWFIKTGLRDEGL